MTRLLLLAAAPLLIASPALAQHEGHAGNPTQPPAAEDEVVEAMAWPESLPDGEAPAAPAVDHSTMDHAAMGHGSGPGGEAQDPVGDAPPPPASTDHAADRFFDRPAMDRARRIIRQEHGGGRHYQVIANVAEYQVRDGNDGYRWEGEAWFGGDLNRLVVKSEGEGGFSSGIEGGEIQTLYSRALGPYFDLQAGVRQDIHDGPKRTYATIGFEGLAPYWFETEGALFLSNQGELLARLEGSYDLRLTQRWILQPWAEAHVSAKAIPELKLGAGLTNLEAGVRLRYEITRRFAPYVGVSWDRKLGRTADFARADGEDPLEASIVIGVRAWL